MSGEKNKKNQNSTMKVYIAGSIREVEQSRYVAKKLIELIPGIEITSRWLHGKHSLSDTELTQLPNAKDLMAGFAIDDLEDLINAETVLLVTDNKFSHGGRHTEFGFALASNKRLVIYGPRENAFHYLEQVEQGTTIAEIVEILTRA